jgi:mono/diheme cytochrome c family protein
VQDGTRLAIVVSESTRTLVRSGSNLLKELNMRTSWIKLTAIIFFAVPVLLLMNFKVAPTKVAASAVDDAATVYKAKCAVCHTPKADKFYDPAKPEADQVQVILKGKKGEKPPYMPGYEAKGMTEDEAKGLNAFMKGLRTP